MINILQGVLAGLTTGAVGIPYAVPTTGLLLDLDATYGVGTSGSTVTSVTDRSPNAEPIGIGGAPTLNATGINGHPAINTSTGAFTTGNSISVGSRTYYVVATILGNSTDGFATLIYQNSAPLYIQLLVMNGGNVALYINNALKDSGIGYTVGVPMIIKAVIGVNTNQIFVNGVAGTLHAHDAFSAIDMPFKIGNAGGTANSLLGRVLLYNGVQTTGDATDTLDTITDQFD